MAHEQKEKQAADGTKHKAIQEDSAEKSTNDCPAWDNIGVGGEMLPFFSPKEELKKSGFEVRFLSDRPRKETDNRFDEGAKDFWFDVEYQGEKLTWTISQISLLIELKRNAPLEGKSFEIKLIPVDNDFRKQRPKYKGKERYEVTEIRSGAKSGEGPLAPEVVEKSTTSSDHSR
jgi:hypothetical protein